MVNYKKGKIYKIVSEVLMMFMWGVSAQRYLCQRMEVHRAHYKRYLQGKGK